MHRSCLIASEAQSLYMYIIHNENNTLGIVFLLLLK